MVISENRQFFFITECFHITGGMINISFGFICAWRKRWKMLCLRSRTVHLNNIWWIEREDDDIAFLAAFPGGRGGGGKFRSECARRLSAGQTSPRKVSNALNLIGEICNFRSAAAIVTFLPRAFSGRPLPFSGTAFFRATVPILFRPRPYFFSFIVIDLSALRFIERHFDGVGEMKMKCREWDSFPGPKSGTVSLLLSRTIYDSLEFCRFTAGNCSATRSSLGDRGGTYDPPERPFRRSAGLMIVHSKGDIPTRQFRGKILREEWNVEIMSARGGSSQVKEPSGTQPWDPQPRWTRWVGEDPAANFGEIAGPAAGYMGRSRIIGTKYWTRYVYLDGGRKLGKHSFPPPQSCNGVFFFCFIYSGYIIYEYNGNT